MLPKPTRSRWLLPVVLLLLASGSLVLLNGGWQFLSAKWHLQTAKSLLNMGGTERVRRALAVLQKAEAGSSESSPELLFQLGRTYRRTGEVEKGLDYLKKAASAGWDPEQINMQRELAMFQLGRIEDADKGINRLLKKNVPDEVAYEVYEAMAKGYLFAFRFTDALNCLDFWTQWCQDATDPLIWRAGIWEQTERWEKANTEYRAVLKIDPGNLEARLALGRNLLRQLNQPEAASREFQICLKASPDDFNGNLGLAASERQLANTESAEKRMRALLRRDLTKGQLASVRMELGQILLDRRELPEAIDLLEKVVEAEPLNSNAWYSLGSAYAGSGNREKATACMEKSKDIGEKFNRMTTITTELITHPEKADLRWEAGKILMDQGMYTEGAAWMSTALIYDPGHKQTHETLKWYYEKIKPDARLAQKHADQAAGANPGPK